MSITITFTDNEVKALDLCLNGAGNAEAWLDNQPLRWGEHYPEATAILSASRRIASFVHD